MSKAKTKKSPKKSGSRGKVERLRPANSRIASIGDNGRINKALVKIFEQDDKMDEDKKQINKAQRDLRAKAKEEHGIDKAVYMHEKKLRKMDNDRRIMFETGCADLKDALGYQFSLTLADPSEQDDSEARDPEEAAEAAAS